MTTYNHLNIPDQWNQYYSKYPEGYTILEALLNWVQQVNDMTDNVNDWNTYLDAFKLSFDKDLQSTVEKTLTDWQTSGFLNVVISEALQTQTNTIQSNLDGALINIKYPPIPYVGVKMDGVTDDSAAFQALVNAFPSRKLFIPNEGTMIITSPIVTTQSLFLEGEGGTLPNIYNGKQSYSKIKYTGFGSFLQIDGTTIDPNKLYPSGSRIRNLIVEGNANAGTGLLINSRTSSDTEMRNITLENVFFKDFLNGWAFEIHNSYSNTFINVNVENCGGVGILRNAHATSFFGGSLEQSAFGLYVQTSRPVNLYGTTIEAIQATRPNCNIPSTGFTPWAGWATTDNQRPSINNYEGVALVSYGSQVLLDGIYAEGNDWTVIGELNAHVSLKNSYVESSSNTIGSIDFAGIFIQVEGNQFVNDPSKNHIYIEAAVPPNYAYIEGNLRTSVSDGKLMNSGYDYAGLIESQELWGRTLVYKNTTVQAKTLTADTIMPTAGGKIEAPYFDVDTAIRKNGNPYIQFDDTDLYVYKPVIQDAGTYNRAGHTAPAYPAAGDFYFDTTAGQFKGFNGTAWVVLG